MNLRSILLQAADIGSQAQKEVLSRQDIGAQAKYKSGGKMLDIVTKADIESENRIREFIVAQFPGVNIFGEEFGASYNGNGSFWVVDPLDCTFSAHGFHKDMSNMFLARFGPIIGFYVNGINIGSVVRNSVKEITYVATPATGFERFGKEEILQPEPVFFIEGHSRMPVGYKEEVAARLREKFSGCTVVTTEQNVLSHARVHAGLWLGYFHPGLALHDIAADPLFGRLTGTTVTDHRGRPLEPFNPQQEAAKYQAEKSAGRREILYSHPILIAKPEVHDVMMKVIEPFLEAVDRRQNPA